MDSTLLRDITERNPGLKLRNIVSFPTSFGPISTKYIFASVNNSPSLEVGERWRPIGQLNRNYYYYYADFHYMDVPNAHFSFSFYQF